LDAADGKEVRLSGQHMINQALTLSGNGGTLSGMSWDTSIKLIDGSASGIYLITNTGEEVGAGVDDWLIYGFTIDCNRAETGSNVGIYLWNSDNNRIENMNIKSAANHGIALEGSNDNWVVNNRVTDFESFGIVLIRGSNRNKVVSNNLQSSVVGSQGIVIDDYSTSGDSLDSSYNLVTGNTVKNCDEGIQIEGCSFNTISDNILIDQLTTGIMTGDGSPGDNVRSNPKALHNLIQGNIIYSATENGMRDYGQYNTINNNYIFEAGEKGLWIRNCLFSSVTGNTLIMDGTTTVGIYVDGGQQTYVSDNKLSGVGTFGGEGIYATSDLDTLQNSDISNNRFFNIGKEGIKIVKGTNPLRQIEIAHNKFYNVSSSSGSTYYCVATSGAVQTVSTHDNWWRGAGDAAGLLNQTGEATTSRQWGNVDADEVPFDWSFDAFSLSLSDATTGTLTGSTDKIEINVPSDALILAASMNNTLVVSDTGGDDTYTAAFSGGNTKSIGGTIAAALNTKTKEMFDVNAVKMVTTAETDITLTPNGGNFSGGKVRAQVWYLMVNDLPDA